MFYPLGDILTDMGIILKNQGIYEETSECFPKAHQPCSDARSSSLPPKGDAPVFFMEQEEDLGTAYRLDFADLTKQDGFRLIYYEVVDPQTPQQEVPRERFNESYGLLDKEAVDFYDIDDRGRGHLYDVLFQTGHRVSGYPYLMQTDPRGQQDHEDKNIPLFQLDSDQVKDVSFMWGDVGEGNFFISEEDLLNCNFGKVPYNWDCG